MKEPLRRKGNHKLVYYQSKISVLQVSETKDEFWRFWIVSVLAKSSGQFYVSVLDLNQKPDLGRTLP